jgi:hypothetical protein
MRNAKGADFTKFVGAVVCFGILAVPVKWHEKLIRQDPHRNEESIRLSQSTPALS